MNSLHNVQNKLTWHVDVVFDNIIHLDILFKRNTINTASIDDGVSDNQTCVYVHGPECGQSVHNPHTLLC